MRTLPIILLLTAGLVACGDSASQLATRSSDLSSSSAGDYFSDLGLLQRIMVAPSRAAHAGRREVSFFVQEQDGVVDELTYVEEVISDGNGLFRVEMEDLLAPQLSPERVEIFKLIQRGREEFFYNHRDFRVRDLELFLDNYQVDLRDETEEFLGRECLHLDIRRNGRDGGRYEIEVDRETGLVIVQREYDSENRLASEVAFVELTVGPVSAANLTRARRHAETSWRPADSREDFSNLELDAPSLPAPGFQLLEQRIVTDPLGAEWYELIYGDGVEQLFMLYALDPQKADRVVPENEVVLYRHGRWTVVEGLLRGDRVIVLGKVSQDALMLMLESCL